MELADNAPGTLEIFVLSGAAAIVSLIGPFPRSFSRMQIIRESVPVDEDGDSVLDKRAKGSRPSSDVRSAGISPAGRLFPEENQARSPVFRPARFEIPRTVR